MNNLENIKIESESELFIRFETSSIGIAFKFTPSPEGIKAGLSLDNIYPKIFWISLVLLPFLMIAVLFLDSFIVTYNPALSEYWLSIFLVYGTFLPFGSYFLAFFLWGRFKNVKKREGVFIKIQQLLNKLDIKFTVKTIES